MARSKKTASQVLQRLMDLCDYFNEIPSGKTTTTNEEFKDILGYTDRKQIQRDLKRLEEMGYIHVQTKVTTPVDVSNGSAKQYLGKVRTISFIPSDNGLMTIPQPKQPGDVIGKGMYNGQEIMYTVEEQQDNEWIIGPDHTLIKNPNF